MRRQERAEAAGESAWPDLPPELLDRIIRSLSPVDRVAVRLVCASWRACVRESFPSDLPFEVPRLLIRRPSGHGGELAFFSLRDRRILPFRLPDRLRADPSTSPRLRCSPCRRWSSRARRPPVECWVAAALGRGGTIALFHPAVSSWMTIGIEEGERRGGFRDMAFWRGGLCALGYDGAVLAFRADLGARAATVSVLREAGPQPPPQVEVGVLMYLVESEGELMLVRKLYRSLREVDLDVEVRLLVSPPEKRRWDLLAETPGMALFVGAVVSAAVPVALYNASASGTGFQIRDSCVYFARREVEMMTPHAICEYSLLDEQIKGVPVAGGHDVHVDPVWITPVV
ncbi:hypothetical protein PR202_ga14209 [Eleusine coracana subsp. coracana]|uniref:F-box domain-containing protein n=1 Tax=Eleusine coracana subsp. coracana TaxID=191504 RepID=A0AAV5CGW7_ELECO|nr:hypothetical protein PR202_ga14209 [Eleusine coracana subsp. coracana]